jgi:peroxiredoxin
MKGIEAGKLTVGDVAPEFDLASLVGGVKQRFQLRSALERGALILAFYPNNWDAVTAQQLREYQANLATFAAKQTQVVGITVDSIMNATAWEREIGPLDFPVCADFWPHGEVCRAYGVFREAGPRRGSCERSIFIVGRERRVAARWMYADDESPKLAPVLAALT